MVTIGKIYDLYAGVGITEQHASRSNVEGMESLAGLYREGIGGATLYLLNLVDFDMLWGHRNDPAGMAQGLSGFDAWLDGFLRSMRTEDLLVITADHGNDPTTPSTDHSREYVPLLVCHGAGDLAVDLGTRETFADVAATLAEFFGVPGPPAGSSFLPAVRAAARGGEGG